MKEEDMEMILKLMEENGLMEALADCKKQGYDPKEIVRDLIANSEDLEAPEW